MWSEGMVRAASGMVYEYQATGEAVYFNPIRKNGKDAWIIQGIGSTMVIGRDRQKLKSRTFTQYPQAEFYLKRHGFETETYK